MSVVTRAREMNLALETAQRADGSLFIRLKDGSPIWMADACHHAHGGLMPDDHRYQFIEEVCGVLANLDDDASEDEIDDAIREIEADIYTGALTAWLASNNLRHSYCDDFVNEFGWPGDTFKLLAGGQWMEKSEVAQLLVQFLGGLDE